jgi:hypothetical protein
MDFHLAHRHFDIGEDHVAGDPKGHRFDIQQRHRLKLSRKYGLHLQSGVDVEKSPAPNAPLHGENPGLDYAVIICSMNPLEHSIAFGPIPSRWLGRSLGVNHIPAKVCSYACRYLPARRGSVPPSEHRRPGIPAGLARSGHPR